MQKEVHVIAAKAGWIVQWQGRVLSIHQTERVAVERARKAAKRNQSELIIHRPDGRIRLKYPVGMAPATRRLRQERDA